MLRQISTTSVSLLALLFFFSSCTKDAVVNDTQDIEGTWAVTDIRSNMAYDWNGDGRTETDIYGSYSFCQRDIVLVFEPNGYGQSRQGCNASWQSMYWQLTNSNRTLSIGMSGDDLNLDLTHFSSNTIRGEDHVYVDGRNFVITYTLSRR